MQFVVIGRDGDDAGALGRRLAVREAHIALTDQHLKADTGHMIFGAAILNEHHEMRGSVMIVEFDSRQDLENWLKVEPYATADVWRSIAIEECRVGPSFSRSTS